MVHSLPAPELLAAVTHLADATQGMSDADLGQPYQWGAHQEGVRFALLGAMHELRALAVRLAAERRRNGPVLTRVHHALAQYHAAFRDLDAVLVGVSDDEYDQLPAPGEWPLRYVYGHMVGAERNFFALVHYGLRRQRSDEELSPELPDGEANRLVGAFDEFRAIMEKGTRDQMSDFHTALHDRALAELAGISDEELDGPSVWWEQEPYTLEYRVHRMEAHLRQHTVQLQKTRDQLGKPATEARRLLRLVYAALAEAEASLIGAPDLEVAARATTAESIHSLADGAIAAVNRAGELIAALASGDRERVALLLVDHPQTANASSRDGVPVARLAVYYGQKEIAETIANVPGVELEIWEGAALGRLAVVEENHRGWGDFILNEYSRDGYTPLQLACFFGREDVTRYLLDKGADVTAVSRNPMAIQPLHAAVAGDHTAIVAMLLEAGADPNTAQQEGFRPLHSAAQNGNVDIIRRLLEAGADPTIPDTQGRPPSALAAEGGFEAIVELLTGDK